MRFERFILNLQSQNCVSTNTPCLSIQEDYFKTFLYPLPFCSDGRFPFCTLQRFHLFHQLGARTQLPAGPSDPLRRPLHGRSHPLQVFRKSDQRFKLSQTRPIQIQSVRLALKAFTGLFNRAAWTDRLVLFDTAEQ